jgi:hypothetical protein
MCDVGKQNGAADVRTWRALLRPIKMLARKVIPGKREQMVLVYHMGKVGSTSIFESLVTAGVPNIHHLNRLNPDNIEQVQRGYRERDLPVPPGDEEGLRVYEELQALPFRIKCISPVRDPIRRNLSAFFFTDERFTGEKIAEGRLSIEVLLDCFLREYAHDVPLTWFDVEMKQTLGVDVYKHPFAQADGFQVISEGACDVLLLKCEMDDGRKTEIVRDFLDIDSFRLQSRNRGQDKDYGSIYAEFTSSVSLPDSYLDRLCNARYTKHFYSQEEIAAMRERWERK